MGAFASPPWLVVLAWGAAAIIIGLNVKLLVDLLT
jgi:Mn2+/Fe2+ NRAMP family transporter